MQSGQGQDDFVGLRRYAPGDSLRQVAWKAFARGQPVMTKQFSGLEAGELWLTWLDLPADMRLEARLSRLTRWVLEAGARARASDWTCRACASHRTRGRPTRSAA